MAAGDARLLLLFDNADISYTGAFKSIVNSEFSKVFYEASRIDFPMELILDCRAKHVGYIATTSFKLFRMFVDCEGTAAKNEGTVGTIKKRLRNGELFHARIILLPRLKTLYSQNHGKFLTRHYLKKLARTGHCLRKDLFQWEFLTPSNVESTIAELNQSSLCAVDIETTRENLAITSCAYTYIIPGTRWETATVVVQCNAENYPFCISALRRLNDTAAPKVMQNGIYDSVYFIRFNAPLRNWYYDTLGLMFCIYPELSRDLAFISSFFLDNFKFWKEEASENLYQYNAKDTHNTLWVFLAMIHYINSTNSHYAIDNYCKIFPGVFPSLSCALDGIEIDMERQAEARKDTINEIAELESRLQNLIGLEGFNISSPKQVGELIRAIRPVGASPLATTGSVDLLRWREKEPVYSRLIDTILELRRKNKALSTYIDVELLNGRLLYSLNPFGTVSTRFSSKSSAFWCGTQIQNIPPYARKMCKAEDGWTFSAVDKAQSESYCTGYISQDRELIRALATSPDFHCHNASMFFGIPFDELYDRDTGEVLQPKIRKLSKPVNHGANYNMQARVLLETMTEKNVIEARKLLGYASDMPLLKVTQKLLDNFDRTYPRIRGRWYQELKDEIKSTGKIYTPGAGLTRRTFLRPYQSKPDLNELVSHKPQCLSVALINQAFVKLWRDYQTDKWQGKFRLKAQIHDEILAIFRDEFLEEGTEAMKEIMVIPIEIEGRVMSIPSTSAIGKYWNEAKG